MKLVTMTRSLEKRFGLKTAIKMLKDAGFDVETVDLSKDDFSDDTRIVVINNPVYDFAGIEGEGANEIEKLDRFLDSYGCLMVFSSPENSGNLKNLSDIKKKYDRIKNALDEVEATGYGIVMPDIDELTLKEPEIVKQGGRYGVRLQASAPSIHMICNKPKSLEAA